MRGQQESGLWPNGPELAPLRRLYEEIDARGRKSIAMGGQPDENLLCPQKDTRMSIALVFRLPESCVHTMEAVLDKVRQEMPEVYCYSPQDLHITILDLQRGRPGLVCTEETAGRYSRAIHAAMENTTPFRVRLCGLAGSESAILAKGYYTRGLAQLRRQVRNAVQQASLPLEERYETISCHVTVARFGRPLLCPEKALCLLDRFADIEFGEFTVSALQLVHHNWYDSKKTVWETFTW